MVWQPAPVSRAKQPAVRHHPSVTIEGGKYRRKIARFPPRAASGHHSDDKSMQTMTSTLGEPDQLANGIRAMFGKFKL